MTDIILQPASSEYELSKVNTNFTRIANTINDEILHLIGGNNTMQQQLDMNSNRIINVAEGIHPTDGVNLSQVIAISQYYNDTGGGGEAVGTIQVNDDAQFNLQNTGQNFIFFAAHCPPNTQVYLSVDGGPPIAGAITDDNGYVLQSQVAGPLFGNVGITTAGTYTFQYTCGAVISDVFTIIVIDEPIVVGVAEIPGSILINTDAQFNLSDPSQDFILSITHCDPSTQVTLSVNGGPAINGPITDSKGNRLTARTASVVLPLVGITTPGIHTLQYTCGDVVSDLFEIVVIDEPTGSTGGYDIAVIGDSFCNYPGWTGGWVNQLRAMLAETGLPVSLGNFSQGALTYFRANSADPAYEYFDGMNCLDALIASSPKVVIVSMGFNDALTKVDGRSMAQVETDIDTFYDKLTTELPNAFVIYMDQIVHDDVHHPLGGSSLQNQHVIPYLFDSTMVDANGSAVESRLTALLNATKVALVDDKLDVFVATEDAVETYVAADRRIVASTNLYKPHRSGFHMETVHLSEFGQKFIASDVYQVLKDNATLHAYIPLFSKLSDYNVFNDIQGLWDASIINSGSGWTYSRGSSLEAEARGAGLNAELLFHNWFRPPRDRIGASIQINRDALFNLSNYGQAFILSCANCPSNEDVILQVNGGATYTAGTTDGKGYLLTSSTAATIFDALGLTPGSHTFQYTCGEVTSELFDITVVNNPNPTRAFVPVFDTSSTGVTAVNSGYVACAGLSLPITVEGSGGVLIQASLNLGLLNGSAGTRLVQTSVRILRNGTPIATFEDVFGDTLDFGSSNAIVAQIPILYKDSAAPVGANTYTFEFNENTSQTSCEVFFNGTGASGRLSTACAVELPEFA